MAIIIKYNSTISQMAYVHNLKGELARRRTHKTRNQVHMKLLLPHIYRKISLFESKMSNVM